MEMGAKKEFSIEVFDSIIAEFKVSSEKKKSKIFKAKKRETKLVVELEGFPGKTL